ncbi:MAG: hypothetical protein ACJ78T_18705, partial [Myxococcales bacterium]
QIGGYLSVGGYYALQDKLFHASDGTTNRSGFMGGVVSPDINVNLPWLLKINFAADVQTGKNVFGAAGGGVGLYFTDKIALLTGPVYFFDPASQPGGRQWFWTVQLDVDLPLRPAPAATAPAPVAAAPTPAAAPAPADSQPAQAVPAVDKKAEADAAKKP